MRKTVLTVTALLALLALPLGAEGGRGAALDLRVVLDCASLRGDARAEALAWFGRTWLDGILQEGDTLRFWAAGQKAALAYEGVAGRGGAGPAKEALAGLAVSDGAPDLAGALRGAAKLPRDAALSVTLILCGSAESLSKAFQGSDEALIRYAKVETFPRWRLVTVGVDIADRVKKAGRDFMAETKRR
ncbi:MAG: hypothetical protein LBR16_08290 [Treponema sp.]|jgi:hypothetical protein|nr:hypothetical protein [Treponema sp.]